MRHSPASHAFKKEVAMNGSNRILSARLGEDIIVTSSPGERSVHELQGLDLSNGQHISHNHALNNCHDSMTNHKKISKHKYCGPIIENYNFYYNKSQVNF